ncbi:MAG: 30S ribosomal protein S16 [Candidatus Dormiibacterota bacterium]
MAVKIRLKRMGAKKRPFYRVVVADARSPRDGRFIESVGYYDPLKKPKVFHVDNERIQHWMATGARPSDAVRELLEREGTLPKTAHPVRTKIGPKHAAKPGQRPAVAASKPETEVAEVEPGTEEAAAAADSGQEVAEEAPADTEGGEEITAASESAEGSEESPAPEAEGGTEDQAPEAVDETDAADTASEE